MIIARSYAAAVLVLSVARLRAEDWPQWRGPLRDGVSRETGLLNAWPEGGPSRIWHSNLAGIGYAGLSVADGRLFTMGARNDTEYLLAFDSATGRELWAAEMGPVFRNSWGDGPRGTPTAAGSRVYALGADGTLICASATDGAVQWTRHMAQLGGKVPTWGYSESVLVDDGRVICTPGGAQGALAALDADDGRLLWRSTEFTDAAQYVSPLAILHGGLRQYLQLTLHKLASVAADDGRLVWSIDWPGRTAVIPTPIFSDGLVYATAGYNVGCKLLRIAPEARPDELYANTVMVNHHGGVVLFEGHLYGYSDRHGWVCQNLLSGEAVWSERGALGKGSLVLADGKLYCLSERDGVLVLADASPAGWTERARFTLQPQSEQRSRRGGIWTHPVVSHGRLYLRDQELIYCYDVSSARAP